MKRNSVSAMVLLCGLMAGCSSSTEPRQAGPGRLEAITPTSVTGTVKAEITPAPSVRVSDENGNPLQGVQVLFEFTGGSSGPGSAVGVVVTTDVRGTAAVAWTLGTRSGPYNLTASSAGLPSVEFTAVAQAGPLASLRPLGTPLLGLAGATLPASLVALAEDAFSNPIPGLLVTFTVVSGDGIIAGDSAVTDSLGAATSGSWTLGVSTGEQTVIARSADAEAVFTAMALTPEECELLCASTGELAFVRDGQIFRVRSDGTGLMQLTSSGANSDPAWSPDGRRIAFASDRDGGSAIYVMDADGSNLQRRTNAGAFNSAPAWSPDGRKIAFSSLRDGDFGIYVMRVDEDWWNPQHVGFDRGFNAHPAWSPDGSRIAFTSDWRAFDFVYDLYVMNADGSDLRLLLAGPFLSMEAATYYFQPAWSPDGGTLAVVLCGDAWDDCYPNSSIARVNSDGSGLRSIASAGGFARPSWSPDGRTIAFASSACGSCPSSIHYVTADGSSTGVLVSNAASPAWRP